jgi:hypothetical protein
MSSDEARRRVEIQETSGALFQLDAKHPRAAAILAGLTKVIAAEAVRSPRFAQELTEVFALADAGLTATQVPVPTPRKRAVASAARKKVVREPGAFDPFAVLRDNGEKVLVEKLAALDIEGLRDIIAEQELDTRKETGRKRKPEVLVAWIVERVNALASKGSVFK